MTLSSPALFQTNTTLPTCVALVTQLLHQYPPPYPSRAVDIDEQRPQPLGAYLCALGYLTPDQCAALLVEQQQLHATGIVPLFGELLVQRAIIPLPVLTAVLLVQLRDRVDTMAEPDPTRPLGEHVLATGHITAAQLAAAIQLQMTLRNAGVPLRLGKILVQQGALTATELTVVLATQQRTLSLAACLSNDPHHAQLDRLERVSLRSAVPMMPPPGFVTHFTMSTPSAPRDS